MGTHQDKAYRGALLSMAIMFRMERENRMDEVRKMVEVEVRKARSGDCTALHCTAPSSLVARPWQPPWQPPNMGRSSVPAAIHPSKPVRKRVEDINGGQK
jgi:hypothetical protein